MRVIIKSKSPARSARSAKPDPHQSDLRQSTQTLARNIRKASINAIAQLIRTQPQSTNPHKQTRVALSRPRGGRGPGPDRANLCIIITPRTKIFAISPPPRAAPPPVAWRSLGIVFGHLNDLVLGCFRRNGFCGLHCPFKDGAYFIG